MAGLVEVCELRVSALVTGVNMCHQRSQPVDGGQTTRGCRVDFSLLRRLLGKEGSARLRSQGAREHETLGICTDGDTARLDERRRPGRGGRRSGRRRELRGSAREAAQVRVSAPWCT